MTFRGDGVLNTESFYAVGSLRADWKLGGNCVFYAKITAADGRKAVFESLVDVDARGSGTNYVYNLEPGLYYIKAVGQSGPGCPWTITLTPL